MNRPKLAIFLAVLAATFTQLAGAQAWPNRPLRWVLPYPAGGSGDVLTRTLAQQLATRLGQPVAVENRSGANGLIGSDVVAKAAPDGYTLLMGVIGPLSVLPHLVKMQYGPGEGPGADRHARLGGQHRGGAQGFTDPEPAGTRRCGAGPAR